MATLTAKHFDALDYVKKSKELGVPEQVAEFQARQIEQLAEMIEEQNSKFIVLETKEPATKKDLEITKLELQREIEIVRNDIKKSEIMLLIIFGAGFLTMLGVLAKGFHWI
ncbi:MAG: hypothetical protein ACK4M7_10250 [Burkholderiales bacterium]|jgi:hypothetical protein